MRLVAKYKEYLVPATLENLQVVVIYKSRRFSKA